MLVTRIEDPYHAAEDTHYETACAPLQADSDGVTEQDDHHRDDNSSDDQSMGTKAFHRCPSLPNVVQRRAGGSVSNA